MKNKKTCLNDPTSLQYHVYVTYILRITALIKIHNSDTTHTDGGGDESRTTTAEKCNSGNRPEYN